MDDDDSAYPSLNSMPLPNIVHAIRMESQDEFCVADSAVEAAICLFNYSQAHKCLASLEGSPSEASRFQIGAQELARMAFTLLWSSRALRGDVHSVRSSPMLNRTVLVAILALLQLQNTQFPSEVGEINNYGWFMQSLHPYLVALATKEGQFSDIAAGAA